MDFGLSGFSGFSGVPDLLTYVGVGGMEQYKRDMEKLDRLTGGHADTWNKKLNYAIGAGTAAFVGATTAAMIFESSFAGVAKTTDGVVDNFGNLTTFGEELAKGFRNLALEIPMSVNELNKIGELGSQLGVPKQDLLEFTKIISMLGTTTDMSIEMAATELARFLNVTQQVAPAGMSMAEQISRTGSAVNSLGQSMAAGEAEIVEFANRIAKSGNVIGLTQAEIVAFSASLASVGLNAEAGGTAFSRVMIDMSQAVNTNNDKLKQFAEIAGIEVPKFAQLFRDDASEAIRLFITGLGQLDKSTVFTALNELELSDIRVRDTLLAASSASDLFTGALERGTKAYEENTSLANEATIRFSTLENQFKLLKNAIVDQLIEVGFNKFLPILKDFTATLNENPALIQSVVSGVGAFATALGILAIAFKAFKFTKTHPFILGLSLLATAFLAVKAAIDESKRSQEQYYIDMANGVNKIGELEDKYKKLKDSAVNLDTAHQNVVTAQKALNDAIATGGQNVDNLQLAYEKAKQQEDIAILQKSELQRITNELNKNYKNLGIDVGALAGEYGKLSDEQKKIKYDELIAELGRLQQQFDSVSGTTKRYVQGWTDLNTGVVHSGYWEEIDAGVKSQNLETLSQQMDRVRTAIDILNPSMADQVNKTVELNNKHKEIKESTNAVADAENARENAMEAISKAGIELTNSLQNQIKEYEKLLPYIQNDKYATEELKSKIAELNKELFDKKGFDAYNDGMMKFSGTTDTLQPRLQQLHYNLKDISLVGQQSVEPMTKYKNVYEAMDDVLATLNGSQKTELGTLLAIKEQFPLTADQAALLNKAIQLQNDEIDNLTELWLKYRGEVAQVSGNILGLVGEMLDLGPVGKQTFDLMSQGITSLLAGSFDPISFGINAVGMALGFLFQEEEKVVRSTDEVKTSLEQLGFGFDATMKMTENFSGKFQSALVTNFKTQIDYYIDQLTTAEGKSRAMFEKMAADATREMQKLMAVFNFDEEFTKTYESIKEFNDEISRMMQQYGQQTLTQLGGTVNLYYEQISAALGQLSKLDPGSQAWKDLKIEIENAMKTMIQLDPNSKALLALFQDLDKALGINSEFWKQQSAGITDANRSTEDYINKVKSSNPALLDSYKELKDIYSQLTIEQLKYLDNPDMFNQYQDLITEVLLKIKALEQEMDAVVKTTESGIQKVAQSTVVADENVQSFSKTISDIPDINPAINIQNWDMFQEQFNIAKSGIEQLSFLGIDLDTTNADEKILRLIHNMDLYLDKLNPESQAFKEGRAQMLELAQSYYQLAGSIPVELLERWGLTVEEVAGNIDVQTQSVQSLAEGLMEASSQTHSLMSSMEKLFERDTDLQALASSAVRLREVWGNTRFPDIEEKMQAVIDKNLALLNSVDPLSQGYKDLQQQVYYAQAALAVLRGEVETVDEWFKLHGITLKEIEPILGKVSKNVAADADEFDNLDKVMQRVTKTAKDLGNNLNGGGVGTKLGELQSKLIDLVVAFPTYLNQMSADMEQFKDNFKTSSDAIAQLLYFDANLDFTRADEQIAAAMKQMYDFWQKLEPGSPAYLEAEKMLNELIGKFVELGGALPKDLQIMFDKGKLKEDIASIQSEIDKLYEKRQAIEVQVQIKKDELNKRIAEAQAKISELQQQKVLIDAQLIIDMAATRDEIAKVEKSITDFEAQKARIDLELTFDVEATSIEIEKTKAQLSKLYQGKIDIDTKLVVDMAATQAEIDKLIGYIDGLNKEKLNIDVQLQTDLADAQAQYLKDLAALPGKIFNQVHAKYAEEIAALENEYDKAFTKIRELSNQKIEIDAKLSFDIANIEQEYSAKIAAVPEEIRKRLMGEKDELQSLEDQFKSFQSQLQSLEKEKVDIDVKLATDVAKIQSEIDGYSNTIKELFQNRMDIQFKFQIEKQALIEDRNAILALLREVKTNADAIDFGTFTNEIETLTGKTIDWTKALDTAFNTLRGERDEFESNLKATQDIINDMLYFKVDLDTSSMDEQVNAMIYNLQEYLDTLNPDSQAFADAQAALNELISKFKEAGGELDEVAAIEWVGEHGVDTVNAQIDQLIKDTADKKAKVDVDIEAAKTKIIELNADIAGLIAKAEQDKIKLDIDIIKTKENMDATMNAIILETQARLQAEMLARIEEMRKTAEANKVQIDLEIAQIEQRRAEIRVLLQEIDEKMYIELRIGIKEAELKLQNEYLAKVEEIKKIAEEKKANIDIDISAAQSKILELNQKLIDLPIIAQKEKAAIDLEIREAELKLAQLNQKLIDLNTTAQDEKAKIDLDISAAQTRLAELNQLLIDLPEIANKNKAQIDVLIATAQKNILLLRQDIIDLDIWAAQQTASIDVDITSAMAKLNELIAKLNELNGMTVEPNVLVNITQTEASTTQTLHSGGFVKAHSGRYFPWEQPALIRTDEVVVSPMATQKYSRESWSNFNASGDVRDLQLKSDKDKMKQMQPIVKFVVVKEPGPRTDVTIADSVYPRIQNKLRNYEQINPYEV